MRLYGLDLEIQLQQLGLCTEARGKKRERSFKTLQNDCTGAFKLYVIGLLNVNASAKSVSPLSTNTCIEIVQSQKHQGLDRGSSVYKKINLSPNEFFSVYELIMCHQILQSVKPILVIALPGCCFRQLTCSHSVVCILVEGQRLRH